MYLGHVESWSLAALKREIIARESIIYFKVCQPIPPTEPQKNYLMNRDFRESTAHSMG